MCTSIAKLIGTEFLAPGGVVGAFGDPVIGISRILTDEVIRVGGFDLQVPLIVVFGDSGVTPLLGATALENLSMAVDPVNQRLIAVDALLK